MLRLHGEQQLVHRTAEAASTVLSISPITGAHGIWRQPRLPVSLTKKS